jgi:hypothetical protein
MSALAAPPTTDDTLRERVETLAHELHAALEPYKAPGGRLLTDDPFSRKRRVTERDRRFERMRSDIRKLASSPAWHDHALTVELLLTLEDLRAAIEVDPEALDARWKTREAMKIMEVVVHAMLRRLDHEALDDPAIAAKFVADELASVEAREVARLLGTTMKAVRGWQSGHVEPIKRNQERITLIGQLVYELRNSMSEHGIVLWFDRAREQFGDKTPRELIDADVADAARKLRPLARGGRAQLDV